MNVEFLVGNPLIVMFVMGSLGYRARTSVISGLALAQISEFGQSPGLVDDRRVRGRYPGNRQD